MQENVSLDPNADAAAAAVGGAIGLGGFVLGMAILAALLYLFHTFAKGVPEQHRKIEPNQVWLLLIPLFNLFWIFKVTLGISDGYKSALDAVGRGEGTDAGRNMALFYCISIVTFCLAPLGIIFLILWIVKLSDAKKRLAGA